MKFRLLTSTKTMVFALIVAHATISFIPDILIFFFCIAVEWVFLCSTSLFREKNALDTFCFEHARTAV